MISWFSKKQSSVSFSMTEEEYIEGCSACCEAIWLRKLMSGIFDMELDTTIIFCDNQSCIKMTENPVFHDKLKHIEIWYFYIRDMVQKRAIKLQYVSTDEKVVDVLTKPLSWMKFEYFHENLGVVRKDFPCKEEKWWDYKLWTLLGQRGSRLRLPKKGGVIMRRTLMMDDSDDGMTLFMQSRSALQIILLFGRVCLCISVDTVV